MRGGGDQAGGQLRHGRQVHIQPGESVILAKWSVFKFFKVVKCGLIQKFKTTIDENGKFKYYSSDSRPVPPGKIKCKT